MGFMNAESSPHQKKVRLMGTILAIISWFGLVILAFAMVLFFAALANRDAFMNYVADISFFNEGVEGLEESEREAIDDADLTEFLPEGVTLDMTVRELIEADRQFLSDHLRLTGIHSFLTLLIYILIAILFLRIALAWRKADPFSRSTIVGLRWLGAIMLIQFFGGIVYGIFIPHSFTWILQGSEFYDTALESMIGFQGPSLEFGILFITLSWVLEHGQQIKQEQELTV